MSVYPFFCMDENRAREDLTTFSLQIAGSTRTLLAADGYCTNPICECGETHVWLSDVTHLLTPNRALTSKVLLKTMREEWRRSSHKQRNAEFLFHDRSNGRCVGIFRILSLSTQYVEDTDSPLFIKICGGNNANKISHKTEFIALIKAGCSPCIPVFFQSSA